MKTKLFAGAALMVVGPARAFADLNFDATTVAPDAGFDTVPPGWYNVKIDESAMKPTKDGAGAYLELRFVVIDGQYANRKLFTRLNMKNSNQQTVEIANGQLSAICHAVGVLRPQKSEELHGIPLKGKVKIRKGSGEYEDQNEFTAYKNINEPVELAGATPAGEVAAPASFTAGAADGAPAQPWAAAPAAGLAEPAAGAPPAQPWSPPPAESAPAAPAAPVAPAAPEAPHDPIKAAEADGWIIHPTAPGWHYKGQETFETGKLVEKYPAPLAAPAAPAAPPAAPIAQTPAQAPATTASPSSSAPVPAAQAAPPWAQPKA